MAGSPELQLQYGYSIVMHAAAGKHIKNWSILCRCE